MKQMKKTIILLIVLILLVSVDCANNSNMSKNAKLTIASLQRTEPSKTSDLLNSLTPKERYEVIVWMQKNPERVVPFYYMYFADEIFTKNKDEAALWYLIGRIRATEDVQMCKDKTALSQIGIYPMLAPKTLEYISEKKNDKYLEQLIKNAIAWDEEHTKRVSPIWSCYHGLSALTHQPELLPMSDYKKIQKQTRQDFLNSLQKKK